MYAKPFQTFLNDNRTVWDQLSTVESPDSSPDSAFGSGLAVVGQWMIVGSPYYDLADSGGLTTGVAYVFHSEDGGRTWVELFRLKPPATEPFRNGECGTSIVMEGDTVLVGCANAEPPVVLVFARSTGLMLWQLDPAVIPAPGLSTGFGKALAYDGLSAVVGSDYNTVTVFTGSLNVWPDVQTLTQGSPPSAGALNPVGFGKSVAVEGRLLAVGAPFEDGTGILYLYVRNAEGDWKYSSEVGPTLESDGGRWDATMGPLFGTSVSMNSRYIVVGSPAEYADTPYFSSYYQSDDKKTMGAWYVFTRGTGNSVTQTNKIQDYYSNVNAHPGSALGLNVQIMQAEDYVFMPSGWDHSGPSDPNAALDSCQGVAAVFHAEEVMFYPMPFRLAVIISSIALVVIGAVVSIYVYAAYRADLEVRLIAAGEIIPGSEMRSPKDDVGGRSFGSSPTVPSSTHSSSSSLKIGGSPASNKMGAIGRRLKSGGGGSGRGYGSLSKHDEHDERPASMPVESENDDNDIQAVRGEDYSDSAPAVVEHTML